MSRFRNQIYERRDRYSRGPTFSLVPLITIISVLLMLMFTYSYRHHWHFDWTGIREEVKVNVISLGNCGFDLFQTIDEHASPKARETQFWIYKNATDEELIKLKEYPSATIKTLAFYTLLSREREDHFELFKEAFSDTISFFWHGYAWRSKPYMVGEFLFQESVFDISRFKQKLILSDEELKILDSLYTTTYRNKHKYMTQENEEYNFGYQAGY